jgi:predicted nucleic acid-binding protein
MRAALSDTTVLSNFAHVERPDLLRVLFSPLLAPPSVLAELMEGERRALIPKCSWGWLDVVEPTAPEEVLAEELRKSVGPGEAEGLAVARSRNLLILTDDLDARQLAESLGLDLSGTLGCLRDLVKRSILDVAAADFFLARMRERGYRSPVRSLRDLPPSPPRRERRE